MTSPAAHRRSLKNARRKERLRTRRAAMPVSLAEKVQREAHGPIVYCLLQPEVFASGIGTLFFARRTQSGPLATAVFLVDAFAFGVKDVMFELMEPSEAEAYIAVMGLAAPWQAVDPSYARKLLRDAVAYAGGLGLRPHRGFHSIEALFGDVRAEDCGECFVFGHEGKPLYVVGPTETPKQIVMRLDRMVEGLGPEGIDFILPNRDEENVAALRAVARPRR